MNAEKDLNKEFNIDFERSIESLQKLIETNNFRIVEQDVPLDVLVQQFLCKVHTDNTQRYKDLLELREYLEQDLVNQEKYITRQRNILNDKKRNLHLLINEIKQTDAKINFFLKDNE